MTKATRRINKRGNLEISVTTVVEIVNKCSFLEAEENILSALNHSGIALTAACLQSFDTDGSPLRINDVAYTAKQVQVPKIYETPFGPCEIARWVYQHSGGGQTVSPLDERARIIGSATPKFARMVSSKAAKMPERDLIHDLADDHQRPMSLNQAQNIIHLVGALAQEHTVDLKTSPDLPKASEVATIGVGADGASVLITESSKDPTVKDARKGRSYAWRQSMVGTLTLFDKNGEPLKTFYCAQAPPEDPEKGKAAFWENLGTDLEAVKHRYPKATLLGISDGAPDIQEKLSGMTEELVTDFWHLMNYVGDAGVALHEDQAAAKDWSDRWADELKTQPKAAQRLLNALTEALPTVKAPKREAIRTAIGYIERRLESMDYSYYLAMDWPIGSGHTEAGCKCIIKQRLCGTGMRWTIPSAQNMLAIRCIYKSSGQWARFWNNLSK